MTGVDSTACGADVTELTDLVGGYQEADIFPVLLRLLAEGEPVERDRIAAAIGRSGADLDRVLDGIPSDQWDRDGRLVGFGITLVPTAHRFIVEGRVLYTWCATDALMFPAVIGKSALVESMCPATRTPIRIEVHPDRLGEFTPASMVVTRDLPRTAVADIRTSGCVHGNFYASEAVTTEWCAAHPNGHVRSLVDEFAHGLAFVASI